jgi:tetratricopeptide (TPR) repeat protein
VSRTEDALAHLKKAIVNPKKEEEAEISYWLAACYAKQGDDQKAIAEYLKVPYLYTGGEKWGITSEFEAARLYEHLGEFNKAATLYRKIIRSDGDQGRFGRKALAQLEHINSQAGEDE